jgi:hypothetical protein
VAAIAAPPVIDESKSVEEPLTAREVEELRENFAFLRKYRKLLRLKLNATEDLMVNGARDPSHRGVCMHLLRKVDHSAILSALDRLDSPDAKIKLLEGAVRFSSDVTLLLTYLEQLGRVQRRDDAAVALSAGLERIDFAAASAAQMRRVLDLIVSVFDERERPGLLLGRCAPPTRSSSAATRATTTPAP